MGVALIWVGILIAIVGNLWMLVEIFQTGLFWLIGSIIIPFVALVWLILHFREGWRPFAVSLVGGAFYIAGAVMLG